MRQEPLDSEPVAVHRVVVVDNQPLYRAALAEAIRPEADLEIVGTLGIGEDTSERLLELQPELGLIGVNLPACEGLGLVEAIAERPGRPRILVLSSEHEPTAWRALAAGADGFLTKDADADAIRRAARAVLAGETVFSLELLRMAARRIQHDGGRNATPLTQRQRDILRLTSEGLSADEVGRTLSLSTSTVKTHLGHAYEKLGVSSAPAAVCEAMRRGILS
ncbi:MAG TPA: response regulator transcription factor [Solirubrobacteraceae bacterium]|nr:response regulator transcription factor [Solirubrobacteraceae bacterium]